MEINCIGLICTCDMICLVTHNEIIIMNNNPTLNITRVYRIF